MQTGLLTWLTYDGINGAYIEDKNVLKFLLGICDKLKPIEEEIMKFPDGRLDISKTGTFFTVHFPDYLARQISQLAS